MDGLGWKWILGENACVETMELYWVCLCSVCFVYFYVLGFFFFFLKRNKRLHCNREKDYREDRKNQREPTEQALVQKVCLYNGF